MPLYIFSYRDQETNELIDVRALADDQKKALKAFSLKAPAIHVSQIEKVNGISVDDAEKELIHSPPEQNQKEATSDSLTDPAEIIKSNVSDRPYLLGVIGIIFLAIGFYFLAIDPGYASSAGNFVNLQKLNIGQTCAVIGAIFVAAEWRPR